MFETFVKLLVFQLIGEGLAYGLGLPVPGPVIGMILLFAWLVLRNGEAARMAPAVSQLLGQLTLFFVPAAVGIIVHLRRVAGEWLPISVALVVSTVISIVVTALVIDRLRKK